MDAAIINPFTNGYWTWNEIRNSLEFISRDSGGLKATSAMRQTSMAGLIPNRPAIAGHFEIKFRDISDKLDKIIFRRYFQRRVKPGDPDVISIQDIKDIALFLANARDLSIWEFMLERRVEEARKLRQPIVIELEDITRDNLGDLRSMLAQEYLSLIGGLDDAKKFHHMAGRMNDSLSEKDRRLFEMLMSMAVRVVWIALQRKHLLLIELEMNRLFRSDSFNIITHRRTTYSLKRTPVEDRVLIGAANRFERTLLQRSPLVKELIFGVHDHRMLGAGVKRFQPTDARIDYIEGLYSAPEEQIIGLGLAVGLLGIPREEFDPVLISRERTSQTYTKQQTDVPLFKLPPRQTHSDDSLPPTFPKSACTYQETHQTQIARKVQCKLWTAHVRNTIEGTNEVTSQLKDSISHLSS